MTEEIGGPLAGKLDRVQRHTPAMPDASAAIRPRMRLFSCLAYQHFFNPVSLFGHLAVCFHGSVGSDERFIKFGIVFQAPDRVNPSGSLLEYSAKISK